MLKQLRAFRFLTNELFVTQFLKQEGAMFGADKKNPLLSHSPHAKRCFQTKCCLVDRHQATFYVRGIKWPQHTRFGAHDLQSCNVGGIFDELGTDCDWDRLAHEDVFRLDAHTAF
jgi:hypothetical protein